MSLGGIVVLLVIMILGLCYALQTIGLEILLYFVFVVTSPYLVGPLDLFPRNYRSRVFSRAVPEVANHKMKQGRGMASWVNSMVNTYGMCCVGVTAVIRLYG